jgi:hypothetical protein
MSCTFLSVVSNNDIDGTGNPMLGALYPGDTMGVGGSAVVFV